MRTCATCKFPFDQTVYCDCGAAFCRDCFGEHKCDGVDRARFSRGQEPDSAEHVFAKHDPSELAEALFKLRPYQQECLDAVMRELTT